MRHFLSATFHTLKSWFYSFKRKSDQHPSAKAFEPSALRGGPQLSNTLNKSAKGPSLPLKPKSVSPPLRQDKKIYSLKEEPVDIRDLSLNNAVIVCLSKAKQMTIKEIAQALEKGGVGAKVKGNALHNALYQLRIKKIAKNTGKGVWQLTSSYREKHLK